MTDDDLLHALSVLESSRDLDPDDPRFLALERAAAHLRKSAKRKRRLKRKRETARADRALRESERDGPTETVRQRACYVCKVPYRTLDSRYALLCPQCAEDSLARRDPPMDLNGRRALVTGGRIKIGFATALKFLRSGAQVRITTRFPADAARRYAHESDFDTWRDRLEIHGLDFRKLPAVMSAIESWREEPLDILVNNAAQTVWHPPSYYRQLTADEDVSPFPVTRWSADAHALMPLQVDLERTHSWVMTLEDVPPVEMVECQVVNAIVPFLLCSRLKPAFEASTFPDRYIVNVTALEGQFQRAGKLPRHPHTNMAKAALNMLTRTSAAGWAEEGIYMVSVDPGWVSHEGPEHAVKRAEDAGWRPPLDMLDAASRIIDPIAQGLSGTPIHGVLLKDYQVRPW